MPFQRAHKAQNPILGSVRPVKGSTMKQPGVYCVLVVDDHHIMRLGLKAFAQMNDSMTVQWFEAGNLADALQAFREHSCIDLVMLDLNLPDSQGLKSVQRFLAEFPNAKLVVHSATEDEFVVRQALALGVIGFVPKSLSADSMLDLLMMMLVKVRDTSDQSLSHSLPQEPATQSNSIAGNRQARDVLTPTQLKVLELVLAGLNNRQIADECHLALGTVKNTVSSIMLVLNVNSRSHLISLFR
jgi:DNA-binding NarL/FixJ family response regulator